MKNKESGPLASRSSIIFLLTASRASSQEIFSYLPLTSFIGYFKRCSPWPCSRSAAPLAQCAPRLIGLSNTGFWRTHTPFCTTASVAQPTEQCEQIVRLISIAPLAAPPSAAASALRTMPNGRLPATAPAPTPIPERFRKARRSMVAPKRDPILLSRLWL